MLKCLQEKVKDVSVVRRFSFAARFLPSSLPRYSNYVAEFSVSHRPSGNNLPPDEVRVLIENLESLDQAVFETDENLIKEIVRIPRYGGNWDSWDSIGVKER